uniref:Novel immune-type receptor 5 n=1 Tax=Cyprinus carpio TaxID=7962 RepID=A0A8C1J7F6_CYPCA
MDRQLCVTIFLLYEVFKIIYGDIIQLDPVISVHEGDPVVFSCFFTTKQLSMALWYKQVTGEEPRLITSSVLRSSKSQFYNEFDSNHFDVLRGTDSFNLTIVKTVQSDWGTYYCAFSFSNIITFGNGTHLVIKGAKISKPMSLKLPKIELVKSGVKVPLQCSIQNELERLGGEHRLYWFKHGSGESPPGSIYVHGNTNDGCVGRSEADCLSPTCMYNLPKKIFSSSQTGTYCALATCGEILFGNVSKHNPDFKSQNTDLFFLVGLTVLLTSNITINILLCCMSRNGTINATESKYKQIQTTDDDVSVTEYEEVNFWSSPIIAKFSKS